MEDAEELGCGRGSVALVVSSIPLGNFVGSAGEVLPSPVTKGTTK